MNRGWNILMVGVLACASSAWAQDSTPPASGTTPDSATGQQQAPAPAPAYGQQDAGAPINENPPLSGLDVPSLEPHSAPLSYIQPGATFNESADSNPVDTPGGQQFRSITRALGSLTLHRVWSHYDLALDYIGGIGYYDLPDQGLKNLQQMDLDQKINWKRGDLSVRDSFSYLPEGNFGGAYGSLGSQGIQSLGSTAFSSFWSGGELGALGLAPRVLNISLAEVDQTLTPKSAITVTGGYAFTHFYGNDIETGGPFIGSSQTSGEVGYNRLLTSKTQVALVYGYQGFDFSVVGTAFHSHIIQAMYGHQITGRMDLLIAAGPQLTFISEPCSIINVFEQTPGCTLNSSGDIEGSIPDHRVGVAGRFRLRYKFPKTTVELSYQRFETAGSGLFAGAQTDIARVGADRPLTRVWGIGADIGYSRNSRLQVAAEGVPANTYSYGFAAVALHRQFGRSFHAFTSYQFSELEFDNSVCGSASACNRISNRQVFSVGLDWTPRPIRID